MEFNKVTRAVIAFGALLVLCLLPLRIEIAHSTMYYIVMGFFCIRIIHFLWFDTKREERFVRKWERKRQLPKVAVILIEAVKSLVWIGFLIIFAQVIIDGRELRILFYPSDQSFWLPLLLWTMMIAFSLIFGIVSLFEKNRLYERLRS
ncbi:hypothetical protein [Saccharibacillus sp. JS10]|uniref:hypothetical protein n=1 Tax=Saccharibacillus sp. JS10 TaxID=2950552 RepID=UPI00210C6279|nr:hypothetical protein [Saccharibacillus sp. JS10]MCQ4088276.1 hypothetical protein [Saccharibacillus sp. JS10]